MLHKFKYNNNISNFKKQLKKQEKKEKNPSRLIQICKKITKQIINNK